MPSLFDNGAIAHLVQAMTPPQPSGGLLGDALPPNMAGMPAFALDQNMPPGNPALQPGPQAQPITMGAMPRQSPTLEQGPTQPNVNTPEGPSMFDRIAGRVRGLLGGDDMPAGLDQVLTPEQMKQAKPGLGKLLGNLIVGPNAHDQIMSNASEILKMQNIAQEMKQAKDIREARARIARTYAPTANESSDDLNLRLRRMHAEFLRAGDTEMVQKLSEVIKSIQPDKPVRTPADVPQVVHGVDPKTNKPYIEGRDDHGNVVWRSEQGTVPKTAAEAAAAVKQSQDTINKVTDDFDRETTDYEKARSGYQVLQGALKNRNLAQPFAVLDAYARVTNPQAAVRLGTMQMLKEMGSASQKWDRWMKQTLDGTWPKDMVDEIAGSVKNIMQLHNDEYNHRRAIALSRAKRAGVDMENLLPTAHDLTLPGETPTNTNTTPRKIGYVPSSKK